MITNNNYKTLVTLHLLKENHEFNLKNHHRQYVMLPPCKINNCSRNAIRLKLAIQQKLMTGQLRVEQTNIMLNNLTDRGITMQRMGTRQIKAEQAGIIHFQCSTRTNRTGR